MGPTPPGTGVKIDATSAHVAGKQPRGFYIHKDFTKFFFRYLYILRNDAGLQ